MDNIFIPNEQDFRRWIREEVERCLQKTHINGPPSQSPDQEALLSRRDIAQIFDISLVTLNDWVKRGLPREKQRGRVYFLRSEVMKYIRANKARSF